MDKAQYSLLKKHKNELSTCSSSVSQPPSLSCDAPQPPSDTAAAVSSMTPLPLIIAEKRFDLNHEIELTVGLTVHKENNLFVPSLVIRNRNLGHFVIFQDAYYAWQELLIHENIIKRFFSHRSTDLGLHQYERYNGAGNTNNNNKPSLIVGAIHLLSEGYTLYFQNPGSDGKKYLLMEREQALALNAECLNRMMGRCAPLISYHFAFLDRIAFNEYYFGEVMTTLKNQIPVGTVGVIDITEEVKKIIEQNAKTFANSCLFDIVQCNPDKIIFDFFMIVGM